MKSKHLLQLIIILSLFSYSCSKTPIEPLDCKTLFTINFLDKATGENLNFENAPFLLNINISNNVLFGENLVDNKDSIELVRIYETKNVSFKFYSSGVYDMCKDRTFSIPTTEKFLIHYGGIILPDSIIIKFEKLNNNFKISYSLNDSLIDSKSYDKIIQTDLDLPIIKVKK